MGSFAFISFGEERCSDECDTVSTVSAVCITDKASMLFGGSDAPLALGCVYSLGAINMANNGKIQSGVTDTLQKYGVKENRIYINFFGAYCV